MSDHCLSWHRVRLDLDGIRPGPQSFPFGQATVKIATPVTAPDQLVGSEADGCSARRENIVDRFDNQYLGICDIAAALYHQCH